MGLLHEFQRILVLAPHTDDGELGAGGFISRALEQGSEIHYAAFSTARESVPRHLPPDILKAEVAAATASLGIQEKNLYIFNYRVRHLLQERQSILQDMINLRSKFTFDLVLMPALKDIHQDHSAVASEGVRAFKNTSILGYELIWNNLSFDTTAFIRLERRHIEAKIQALAEYKSQSDRDYMNGEFIRSLARARGVQIGSEYAEAYEVVRWVMR